MERVFVNGPVGTPLMVDVAGLGKLLFYCLRGKIPRQGVVMSVDAGLELGTLEF